MNDFKQIHSLLSQNGYKGNYEDFKREVLSKLSDEDLEAISGGSVGNKKLNKIIVSMLSVLSLSGCMANISYTNAMKPTSNQDSNTIDAEDEETIICNWLIDNLFSKNRKKEFLVFTEPENDTTCIVADFPGYNALIWIPNVPLKGNNIFHIDIGRLVHLQQLFKSYGPLRRLGPPRQVTRKDVEDYINLISQIGVDIHPESILNDNKNDDQIVQAMKSYLPKPERLLSKMMQIDYSLLLQARPVAENGVVPASN